MIRDFESWNTALGELSNLDELQGARVAIDAADYINDRILHRTGREPLVPALGGLPLGLRKHIEEDLQYLSKYRIEALFVFSGLDLAKQDDPFRERKLGAEVNAAAWVLYDNHKAEDSVLKFGESPYVTPEDLFPALQAIFVDHDVKFLVAPYSAWAQLAYLERSNQVQAISGSSEILLFDCDKVITKWEFESGTFTWIKRARCVADLKKYVSNGDISDDMFVDACMLAGNHFLPTLPNLDSQNRKEVVKPQGAINMMISNGRTGISVVLNNQDDPRFQRIEYLDRFRRARLAVKHHPILTIDGHVKPLQDNETPNNTNELIGQHLPEELYTYFSKGLVNGRLLSWLATGEIVEPPPVDGGVSSDYRTLVSQKLTPIRLTTLKLLSSAMHNYFQHRPLTVKCWFTEPKDKLYTSTHSIKDLPEARVVVEKWAVKESTFRPVVATVQPAGYLASAVLSLEDADFASKSISGKNVNQPLSTKDEIVYNSIWRFLTLREYVDSSHNLTAWGKVLAKVIAPLKGNTEHEEAALLAVELLRLDLLSSKSMFPYNGAPMRGELNDRENNLLISRVAGLGTLQHKPIGFTGPLSHHLLGYNCIINVVRSAMRDMVEASAAQLFTNAFAKRDINNIPEIAVQLPFLLPNNCALNIAVKTYLDEITQKSDPTSDESKQDVKEMLATRYFPQSLDLCGDLVTAFKLWDAVYLGVSKAPNHLMPEKNKKLWDEANEWLTPRR